MKIETFEDVNHVLAELAKHDSFIAKKEAMLNERINKLKEKYDEETEEARIAKEMLEKELEAFAMLNKSAFKKTRNVKLLFGEIGFRTTPPKVHQLNRKYSVKTSLELIKKLFAGKYIRKKEEIDKEQILTDYAAEELTDDKLAAVGLKIDQDEKFIYKIDWEALDGSKNAISKNTHSKKTA